MMRSIGLLALLAACGGESSPGPAPIRNTAVPVVATALPADAALGELGIAPTAKRDEGSWLPAGPAPFLVEEALREGKGPPPSWIATDTGGTDARVTYGKTMQIQYGCDNNMMTVSALDGDTAKLRPGLLWLRPVDSAIRAPKPVPIANLGKVTAARRDFAIGPLALELVRTEAKLGVANVLWSGKLVHQMKIERHDMQGADNAVPMDFVEGGVGVPVPEVAWSIGDAAVLLVFRVESYEGLSFKALVVNAETGRSVDPMTMYLYRCAF
jgi:hypothetical protein